MASPTWSELLPDLIGRVIALLPFPADRARFRAVCRAWHAAARLYVARLPWIVLPNCSFCVVGEDDDCLHRIPGLPDNAICLGAAADGWLALDCTDDVFRRIPPWEKSFFNSTPVRPRPDVKHDHTYLLHNPFSGEAVSLPELDSIIGHVAETFEIRKVLMRSSSPDDLVAVITNNWNCNVILCCPGKGKCVVPGIRVFDVAFLGDRLYGITPEEELVAVDIDEDEDGCPTVTKCRRVIKKPLGADGWEDPWSWMYDDDVNDDDISDEDDTDDDSSDDDDSDDDSSDNDENDDGQLSASSEEEEGPDEDAPNQEENGDGQVPDGEDVVEDEEVPYETKDYIHTTRRLVKLHGDRELLMVKQQTQAPPFTNHYTRKIEVFKADINAGIWVAITENALAKGEALFLSRCFSKSTRAYEDIKEGFIYSMDLDDVFDMRSLALEPFILPTQTGHEARELLTWLFPPELVL
ncbi:hypothetical protein EJB05_10280, partial [Eragrostis curvula]